MLLVSTVLRNSPPSSASGYLYTVDLENQKVVQRSSIVEPAYKTLENNPRGGMRGSKGISVRPDQIAIANSSMVFRYTPQWEFLGVITHPSCAFIHDILYQDDTIWVASASSDLAFQFDLDGRMLRSFYMREPSPALEALQWAPRLLIDQGQIQRGEIDFRNPATHEHFYFDNAHVNSIAVLGDGNVLVSLGFVVGMKFVALRQFKMALMRRGAWPYILSINRRLGKILGIRSKNTDNTLVARPAKAQSAVVRITTDGTRNLSLMLPNMTTPSHSLLVLPDKTVAYLNTSESAIIRFEPYSGEIISSTPVPQGFLRGVALVPNQTLAVGSGGQLLGFDLAGKSVLSTLKISADPNETIYDVKVLPAHFALPPESFGDHLMRATGWKSPEEIVANRARVARIDQ
jgi:hypothetical protein